MSEQRLISAAFPRSGITSFVARRKKIDESTDSGESLESKVEREWVKGEEEEEEWKREEKEERQLSKVQSSGHGAGHYMGFWGYRGGNRLPWDRSFSSFFSPCTLLFSSPSPPAAFPRLFTHPIERALPTPEFIPGGCYGDAPSSEWRQGIQRRREL